MLMTSLARIFSTKNRLRAQRSPRAKIDRLARLLFYALASLPVILVIIILLSLLNKTWPILATRSLGELLAGQVWLPSQGRFGFFPFIAGTLWVTLLAVVLAVPPCLL